jgi:segregation and condensation protein B
MNYSMAESEEITREYSIEGAIEALLFVSSAPVPIKRIAEALDISEAEVKRSLDSLEETYQKKNGLVIQKTGKRVQLVTNPTLSGIIEKFLGVEVTTTLTQASLEAMAIIAYKQPITRPEIDEIRGVNSDSVVRNLLSKGLIEEDGRLEGVGRPILYGTTPDFLNYFGLASLNELPAFQVLPRDDSNGNGVLKD